MKRHRSVLSRLERVKILQEKGTLELETSPLLGLPKVKHLKIRIKKEKAAAAPAGAEAAPGAVPAEGGAAATPAPAEGGRPAQKAAGPAGPKPTGSGPAKPQTQAGPKKKE